MTLQAHPLALDRAGAVAGLAGAAGQQRTDGRSQIKLTIAFRAGAGKPEECLCSRKQCVLLGRRHARRLIMKIQFDAQHPDCGKRCAHWLGPAAINVTLRATQLVAVGDLPCHEFHTAGPVSGSNGRREPLPLLMVNLFQRQTGRRCNDPDQSMRGVARHRQLMQPFPGADAHRRRVQCG
jgi:hypothetical protein